MEIISKTDFKASINKTMIQGNNKNNNFEILLKENYSHYITSLKKIYPTFKFNHHKRYDKTFSEEYIKKYGEESDMNNRHYKCLNMGNYYQLDLIIKKNDKKYKKSNKLEILGAQDNIEYVPKDFKKKYIFLSKKSISELKMIQKDLRFKTGVIEIELDFILIVYFIFILKKIKICQKKYMNIKLY
jgi:hypothetical protein